MSMMRRSYSAKCVLGCLSTFVLGASALRGPLAFAPQASGCLLHTRFMYNHKNDVSCAGSKNGIFEQSKRVWASLPKPVRSNASPSRRRGILKMQQSPNAEPSEESTYSNAIRNTALAVSAALLFGLGIGVAMGPGKAMEFMTGYVVEESLSVDNLFVFIILFEVKTATESLPCAKGRED